MIILWRPQTEMRELFPFPFVYQPLASPQTQPETAYTRVPGICKRSR